MHCIVLFGVCICVVLTYMYVCMLYIGSHINVMYMHIDIVVFVHMHEAGGLAVTLH